MLDALAEFGGCCFSLHPGSFRCIREAESKDFNGFGLIFSVFRATRVRERQRFRGLRCTGGSKAQNSLLAGNLGAASCRATGDRTRAALSSCRRRGKLDPTDLTSGYGRMRRWRSNAC